MDGLVLTIIGIALSSLTCRFLLNILNNNMWSIFNIIRKDLNQLSSKTRSILSFLGFVFAVLITVVLNIILNMSSFEEGLVLGFLLAIKEACFKDNIVKMDNI